MSKLRELPTSLCPQVLKKSVLKVVLLTFFTLFLYYPVWFLQKRHVFNNLNSPKKVTKKIPVIALLMILFCTCAAFFEGASKEIALLSPYISYISPYLIYISILIDVLLIYQSFVVRRILLDHYQKSEQITISIGATLFIGIFYLQYKINELSENKIEG